MSTVRERDLLVANAIYAEPGEPWALRETVRVDDAFADGCAHRDRQAVAFLRERAKWLRDRGLGADAARWDEAADAIERGEHVPEVTP